MSERLLPTVLWLLGILFVAATVHLASILMLPYLAPRDAYMRLAAPLPVGALKLLSRTGSEPVDAPYRDPAMVSAICRYDLGQGSMRIGVDVDTAAFVALSFYSRTGLPFYGLSDRAANDGRLEVLLLSPSQREKAEAADTEDSPVHEVRVTAPSDEGFVEFDVLPRAGGTSAAEKDLKSAACVIQRGL